MDSDYRHCCGRELFIECEPEHHHERELNNPYLVVIERNVMHRFRLFNEWRNERESHNLAVVNCELRTLVYE